MNEAIGPERGFHSPKKKLSFRNKESSIENVRRDLKDAKDISMRNLIAKLDIDEQEPSDSDSAIEEVVMIEEETEAFEEEEIECVDESDDDSYLQPLAPPIEIPAELRVKEDEYEEALTEGSDDDSDGRESKEKKIVSAATRTMIQKSKKVSPVPTTNKQKVAPSEPRAMAEAEESPVPPKKSTRPGVMRGMTYCDQDAVRCTTETSDATIGEDRQEAVGVKQDVDSSLAWQKPDWTKNAKLRPTGKSPKETLSLPITSLPHLKHSSDGEATAGIISEITTTPKSAKQKVQAAPSTPPNDSASSSPSKQECPKSAPTRPNGPVSISGSDLPKIEWTKPEWTRKKILRETSKGHKIMSGQEIGRPIGGIRPVQN